MTKKITTIAMFAALMVVGGYILYSISKLIPIPGSKFIVMGPYLTFVMMLPLICFPRFGTLSLINIVFGGIMIIISPWMSVAIVASGILADCCMILPIKRIVKQILAMGVYNGISLLTSFYITNYVTGNALYQILDVKALILAFILAVLTGSLGGYVGLKVNNKYLKIAQKYE